MKQLLVDLILPWKDLCIIQQRSLYFITNYLLIAIDSTIYLNHNYFRVLDAILSTSTNKKYISHYLYPKELICWDKSHSLVNLTHVNCPKPWNSFIRLITVPYFFARSSESRAYRYGRPPCTEGLPKGWASGPKLIPRLNWVHLKPRWPPVTQSALRKDRGLWTVYSFTFKHL